jgi:MoaA/NifB/PqqE/SkfB family radical SAM enzyme
MARSNPKEKAMSENINDILKRYEEEARAKQKKAINLRDKVMTALAEAGVNSVTVDFDGYGDSGEEIGRAHV